ncbi:MAG: hypothetical protein Q9207_004771 [Kuettlingeria erythrocarpa]
MSVSPLTSNHVNYLIWRYLQESGYGDAAVKLQRDWIQDPQSLRLSRDIKTHALVLLVQKGLQYYEIEQSINPNGNQFLGKAFFASDASGATSSPRGEVSQDDSSTGKSRGSPRARKHGREPSTANGLNLESPPSAPAAKRSRRSNNGPCTSGNVPAAAAANGERRGSDSMDLDPNGFAHHEPPEPKLSLDSPADELQPAAEGAGLEVDDDAQEPDNPPTRMSLTNGPSVGVQSDRVTDLGPETSVLTVPHRNVLHTAWSPTDPQLLAVAGDALCRIWTVTKSLDGHPSLNWQYVDLLGPGDDSAVTAMAWRPNGELLAIATRNDDNGSAGEIALFSKHGKSTDSLTAAQDMLLALRWNPGGTHLLGITYSGKDTCALAIWDIRSSQALPIIQLDRIATDVVWCDDHRFILSGHSIVAEFTLDPHNNLSFVNRTEPDVDRNWTYVRYDATTQTAALVAEDSRTLAILSANGQMHTTTAHNEEITATAFQPLANAASYSPSTPRRLATSSLDGEIRIWDVTNPFIILHLFRFSGPNPPMAISFTPDGYLLAAASTNRVVWWNAETGGSPKAIWKGDFSSTSSIEGFSKTREDTTGGAYMDADSGIGEEDDRCAHSLSWDINGIQLAYGTGGQVREPTVVRSTLPD